MTEEKEEKKIDETQGESGEKETPSTETKNTGSHMIPKNRFDEVNQKYKDAEKRYKALEKAAQDAETKRLKESDDYKALYEKAQATITELQPKADGAESAQATLKEVLEAQIESIPEAKRSLVPVELPTEKQLAWIARNRSLLSKAQPFDIGAGETGGSGDENVEITDEQKRAAKRVGMSPEDFIKYS